jgi:hypothetical protein
MFTPNKYAGYSAQATNSTANTPIISPPPSSASTPYALFPWDLRDERSFTAWMMNIDANTLMGIPVNSIPLQYQKLFNDYKMLVFGNNFEVKRNNLSSEFKFTGGRKRSKRKTRKGKKNNKRRTKKQKRFL